MFYIKPDLSMEVVQGDNASIELNISCYNLDIKTDKAYLNVYKDNKIFYSKEAIQILNGKAYFYMSEKDTSLFDEGILNYSIHVFIPSINLNSTVINKRKFKVYGGLNYGN